MKIITPFIERLLYAMSYTCVCSLVSGNNLRKLPQMRKQARSRPRIAQSFRTQGRRLLLPMVATQGLAGG